MDVQRSAWTAERRLTLSAGLVVFEDDPISAPTIQNLLGSDVDIHVARMPFPSPGDIEALERSFTAAAATILPLQPPSVIGFSCTTGAIELGRARLNYAVGRSSVPIAAADPAHATFDAFRALGVRRIGIVSPYGRRLSTEVAEVFIEEGFEVGRLVYLDAEDVVSISRLSIIEASRRAYSANAEALFLSCTGMQSVPLIETLEAELELPVVTSLQALAWIMARSLRVRCRGPGRLLDRL